MVADGLRGAQCFVELTAMASKVHVSLANKCQILFGLAVVLILTAALAVPWLRMETLVDQSQRQIAERLAEAWINRLIELGGRLRGPTGPITEEQENGGLRFTLIERDDLARIEGDPFLAEAVELFEAEPDPTADAADEPPRDLFAVQGSRGTQRYYRYARAVRQSDIERGAVVDPFYGGVLGGVPGSPYTPEVSAAQISDPLKAVLVIEMYAPWVGRQVLLNRIYIIIAGLLAGMLAIVAFWFITTRIILSPVRVLRTTAERVAEGDLNIRSDINTGDEYEQLSHAFNSMLVNLKASQEKLERLNKQLDLKVDELARTNVSLFEANKLKTDFLANVSHELRTPLNSIVGFADLLADDAQLDDKRRRYVKNIAQSSRALLQLINELLDLAKIEAGRVDVNVEAMSVSDMCESMVNLMRPQAEARRIDLELSVDPDVPIVRTDPGKFQQILFNFVSNAVKFTPEGGRVEVGAIVERNARGEAAGARVYVSDTGPGIAPEYHEDIFDKFRQIDDSHTRHHAGSGLGLAISRELARLLRGRIELDSDVGRGATFALVVPLTLEGPVEPLMPDLTG